MANTRITRSISSGSTTNKFTLSFWIKKSATHTNDEWLFENYNSGSARTFIRFNTDTAAPRLEVSEYTGTYVFRKITNRVFRDVAAYYHIHIEFNSTLGTEADRLKIYINGVQETSFATTNHPALNATSIIGNTGNQYLGYSENSNGAYFSGIMSHINFTHGYAYAPTSFGEFDANGVWKIKTSPSVTYGSQGFFILKDGNSVTDQSGNSNNFTVASGNLTNTEDCASNVFATWNPLANFNNTLTFSEGNLKGIANSSSNPWFSARATLGFTSGKWYWETKFTGSTDPVPAYIGVVDESAALNINDAHNANGNTLYYNGSGGEMRVDGSSTTNDYGNFSTSDICGVAVNADDNLITIYKNGSAIITDYALSTTRTGFLFPTAAATNGSSGTNSNGLITNFGNGYFGTTAVASAGTNASGIGIFEYDVPTGYTALSTKGLNL